MQTPFNYSPLKPKGYSARNIIKPVVFICQATEAQAVYVTGDFNDWHPTAHPLKRMLDGAWRGEVPLSHGHLHYLFLVDGKPVLDPHAQGTVRNERNEKVSLVGVS